MKSETFLIRGSALIFIASLLALTAIFGCNKSISIEGCKYKKKKFNGGTAYVHSANCKNKVHISAIIK